MAPQLPLYLNRVWNHLLGTPSFEFDNGVSSDSENAISVIGGAFVSNPASTTGSSTASFDILIRHFKADGRLAWSALNGSTYNDIGYGITTGKSGEIYITGQTEGNLNDEINSGKSDIFISRYDQAGTRTWTKLLGTQSDDYGYAITVATNGDIWVTGSTEGNLGAQINSGKKDAYVSCYNNKGELKFIKLIGGNGDDIGKSIAAGPFGSVVITGTSTSSNNSFINNKGTDVFVALILEDGEMLWLKNLGSNLDDSANSIVLDDKYNIYVAGTTRGQLDSETNNGGSDILLAGYTVLGEHLWTRINGTSGEDSSKSIAFGLDGNIYVAATTTGKLNEQKNKGLNDAAVIGYNTEGKRLWTSLIGSNQADFAAGLTATQDGRLVLVGSTNGNLEGNINNGTRDVFTKSFYPSNPPTGINISKSSLAENTITGTELALINGIDPDIEAKFTYSLIKDEETNDDTYFKVDGNKLITNRSTDYESKIQLNIRLRATDKGGLYVEKDFVITITDENEAPFDIIIKSPEFNEDTAIGSEISEILSIDPDSESTVMLELVTGTGGEDNDSFKIKNNRLILNKIVNFEQKNSYSIKIRATDNNTNNIERIFKLNVKDINDTPTNITANKTFFNEKIENLSTVALLTTADEDTNDSFSYYLAPNFYNMNDNDYFYINRNELKIKSLAIKNKDFYEIRVATTDRQGLTFEKNISLVVNKAPTKLKLNTDDIPENITSGSKIGIFQTTDPNINDKFRYRLEAGLGDIDNDYFSILDDSLYINIMPNYEKKNKYNIRLRVEDQGGLSKSQPITISVTDLNEPTEISLNAIAINEDIKIFSNVAEILGFHTNGNRSYAYKLVSGDGDTHNSYFQINKRILQNINLLDYESIKTYQFRIGATDQFGEYSEHELSIQAKNVNERATQILLSNYYINETATTNTPIAKISTKDPDENNQFTYSLINGEEVNNNTLFKLIKDNLYINQNAEELTSQSYKLNIRTTDQDGLSLDKSIILENNKKPSSIKLSTLKFNENLHKGHTIAELSATDFNVNSNIAFNFARGIGDNGNEYFGIINKITLTSAGLSDVYITKIDKFGNFVWASSAGGVMNDYINSINTDSDGSSIITGNFSGSANFDKITLTSTTDKNNFTAKLNSDGSYAWAEIINTKDKVDNSITTLLKDGSSVITGIYSGKLSFGTLTLNSFGDNDIYIAKLNQDGSYAWATNAGGSANDLVYAISSLEDGSTFITGSFSNKAIFGNTELTCSGDQDIFIAKLNADGTFEWANKAGGLNAEYGKGIKALNDGTSYVTGTFSGVSDFGGIKLTSNGSEDVFITKLNSNGSFAWVNQAGGTDKDFGIGVSSIADGSSIISGDFTGNANFGNTVLTSTGSSDVYVAKLNADGIFEWARNAGGGNLDKSHSIEALDDGSSIITGTFIGTSNWEEKSRLVMNKFVDYEKQQSYQIRLRATDPYGLFTEEHFELSVQNIKETSEIAISQLIFNEDLKIGNTIAELSVTDTNPLAPISYHFTSKNSNDNYLFLLENNKVTLNHIPSFVLKNEYLLEIEAKYEEVNTYFGEFILNLNGLPNDINLSTNTFNSTVNSGDEVARLITTDPNSKDVIRYEILPSRDSSSFLIRDNRLIINESPIASLKNNYSIKVKATDQLGLSIEKDLDINALKAMSNIYLSLSLIPESIETTTISTIFTDSASGDQNTKFRLINGNGSTDNSKFTINGNTLLINEKIDFEKQSSYNIRINSIEENGFSIERGFLLLVEDSNEVPLSINLSKTSFLEHAAANTIISELIAVDRDINDSSHFELINSFQSTNDNVNFIILENKLKIVKDLNFENRSIYIIDIRATDSKGLYIEKRINLECIDVNEAPTEIYLNKLHITENHNMGTIIGELSHNDPDKNDLLKFNFVTGNSPNNNSNFNITDGNKLTILEKPDFETKPFYTVSIKASDKQGLYTEQTFKIKVININEAPSEIILSNSNIPYSLELNGKIGILTTIDPDIGNSFKYEILSKEGTDFTGFSLQANTLYLNKNKASELKAINTIIIRSTDQAGLFVDQQINLILQKKPISIILRDKSIIENVNINSSALIVDSSHDELSEKISYVFSDLNKFPDNNIFTIDDSSIKIKASPDYESKSYYNISIKALVNGEQRGETAFNLTVIDENEPPKNLNLSTLLVEENIKSGSIVASISSIDQDSNDSTAYSLINTLENDNNYFRIVGNKIIINQQPNFEIKQSYKLSIRAMDKQGLFNDQNFNINVQDENEVPFEIKLSTSEFFENIPINSIISNILSLDPDSNEKIIYTLTQGIGDNHNSSFKIEQNQLIITKPVDYESQNIYYIRIRATDKGGLLYEQNLELNIKNINEAPVAINATNLSIGSALEPGATIAYLLTTDPDINDIHEVSLVNGLGSTNNKLFKIDENQLKLAGILDYESQNYQIRVRTTDKGGLFTEKNIELKIPQSIVIKPKIIIENISAMSNIASISMNYNNSTEIYDFALKSSSIYPDNLSFQITDNLLYIKESPNFEKKEIYYIGITVIDKTVGRKVERDLTISVQDINEKPSDISISTSKIKRNTLKNTIIANLKGYDPDSGDTLTYQLSNNNNTENINQFSIFQDKLILNTEITDLETIYKITIRATDKLGQYHEEEFTLDIIESVTLNINQINENIAIGSTIANLSTTNASENLNFSYLLVDETEAPDNKYFSLQNNMVKSLAPVNYENKSFYNLQIIAKAPFTQDIITGILIQVVDLNEAPSEIMLSNLILGENKPANSVIGYLSAYDPEDTNIIEYSLVNGIGDDHNNLFKINDNKLLITTSADYEKNSHYSIRVKATDPLGNYLEKSFDIPVINENESPGAITNSSSVININAPSRSAVSILSSIDPDDNDYITYNFDSESGFDDNDLFVLTGNTLRLKNDIKESAKNTFNVSISAKDRSGLSVSKKLLFNLNNNPSKIIASTLAFKENIPIGSPILELSCIDKDIDDNFSYSFVPGLGANDNDQFLILGNKLIINKPSNHEKKSMYSIKIRATDRGGLSVEQIFNLTAENVNESPEDIKISSYSIYENTPINSIVSQITTYDPDRINQFTYEIRPIKDNPDKNAFYLDGDKLKIISALDYEKQADYLIRLRTTDQDGLSFERDISINIINIPEAIYSTSSLSLPTDKDTLILLGDELINATGNISTNTLVGNNKNNIIEGGHGPDLLTGLLGSDTFIYISSKDSNLRSYDHITDFIVGTDLIDATYPIAFGEVKEFGFIKEFTETELINTLSETKFKAQAGIVFQYFDASIGRRSFLALNDNQPGFSSINDTIIEITGYSNSITGLGII